MDNQGNKNLLKGAIVEILFREESVERGRERERVREREREREMKYQ